MATGSTAPSQLPKAQKLRIAAPYFAAYVLIGLMLTSIGPCLDALQAQSDSTTGQISLLFTANSLGYITGSLLAGRLFSRVAGNSVLTGALAAMAVFTITIPWLDTLWLLILVLALIGVALGTMDVGGNTLMVWLYRRDVPPYMNALHLFFGVGAFIGPLVIDGFAVSTDNAVTTYWLFAALMVPVAFWLRRLPSPDSPAVEQPTAGPGVLRRHALLIGLIAVFFFMHMGAELAFGGWIYSYAKADLGSETIARVVNSVFWGGLIVGRLIAIPLALRLSPRALLQSSLVGAAAAVALVIALPDATPVLWIGTIAFGVFIASMFANSINFAEQRMPITSQVTALFLVGGSLGAMILPWAVGQLFDPDLDPASRGWVMWITGATVLGAVLVFGVIQAYTRRPRGRPEPAS